MNVLVTADGTVTIPLDDVVGSLRTFGPHGPAYEVLSVSGPSAGANVKLVIRVVTSGETLDYPLSDAMSDPLAR